MSSPEPPVTYSVSAARLCIITIWYVPRPPFAAAAAACASSRALFLYLSLLLACLHPSSPCVLFLSLFLFSLSSCVHVCCRPAGLPAGLPAYLHAFLLARLPSLSVSSFTVVLPPAILFSLIVRPSFLGRGMISLFQGTLIETSHSPPLLRICDALFGSLRTREILKYLTDFPTSTCFNSFRSASKLFTVIELKRDYALSADTSGDRCQF